MKTLDRVLVGAVATGLICLVAVSAAGYGVNHTASMPLGVWRIQKTADHHYARGDIIIVCPPIPPWATRYLRHGNCPSGTEPMLKPVAAVAGDRVEIAPTGVTVNDQPIADTAAKPHDSSGRLTEPYPIGIYQVAPDQVWVIAAGLDSLDSRYLGPVPVTDIRGVARPIWLW